LLKQLVLPKQDPQQENIDQNPLSGGDCESKSIPTSPAPLNREESNPDDEVSFAGPPTVATSESIGTTSPEGGRFVSNTFSYHTSDNESASSKASGGQKVYRCEDEP
jgi:hypothetical protein